GIPIHVVFEIKYLWEAGSRSLVFGPGAIRVLRSNKVLDTALHAWPEGLVKGAETHDGPGGLGGSAGTLTFKDRVIVSIATFAPAAVFMLHRFQPIPGFQQPRLIHVQVEGAQTAQDLPGAIDVIDTPPAVPGAVFLLVLANEAQRLLHSRMIHAVAFIPEQFQNAGSDIGTLRIQHGIVVCERNFFEHAFCAIFIKRSPT